MTLDQQKIDRAYRKRSRDDCLTFILGLCIPSATGPQTLADCIAPHQRKDFDALLPSIEAVRDGGMPPIRRFWLERTKKASKDADIGAALLWPAAFASRPLYMQIGAADRDQASIVKRRMQDIIYHNKWLEDYVELKSWYVQGHNAKIDILAADIAGSHGETPDILVLNELSHVRKWEFIENLMDNADGVAQGVVIIATNAGFKGTKAEVMRKHAESSDTWYFSKFDKPAPWISRDLLQDARKRNSPARYRRLWLGQWASGKGDALDEPEIDRVLGAREGPVTKPEKGWRYIGGLDLGVSHDHSGFVVTGINRNLQKIRVAWLRGWEPKGDDGEVNLMAVESCIKSMAKLFRLEWVGYDPSQAKLMAQRLRRANVPMKEVTFTPKNLTAMADSLVQVVKSGQLEAYDDLEGRLRRDFGKFTIMEKMYGYKLEAVSDEEGHADVGTALAITLPKAIEMLRSGWALDPDDDLATEDDSDLDEDEIETMPDELREIYEMEEDEPRKRVLPWED